MNAPSGAGRSVSTFALAALVLYAATAAVTPVSTNDTWIHILTGGLVLDEGQVPRADRYSFTAAGNRYVAHEWLAAVAYAVGDRAAGTFGVILVGQIIPVLLLLAALWLAMRAAGGAESVALPLAVLVLTVIRHRVVARPELFAAVLLVTELWLLLRDRRVRRESGRGTRAILLLLPIEAVWANVHGSFLFGPVLALLFAAAGAADDVLDARDRRASWVRRAGLAGAVAAAVQLCRVEPFSFGRPAAALVGLAALLVAVDARVPLFAPVPRYGSRPLRLLLLALGMGAAGLANPLGAELYAFPFEFTLGASEITRTVEEWKPLADARLFLVSLALPPYLFLVAAWCAALARGVRRGNLERLSIALLLFFGLLPLRHGRWMALSALATLPALARTLTAPEARRASPWEATALATTLAAAGVAACLLGVYVVATATPADPALRAAVTICGAVTGVALAIAFRPAFPPATGPFAAAAASLALAGIAFAHGLPELAGLPRRPSLGIRAEEPAGAVALLRRLGIGGRLFTEYDWAGYSLHELWPRTTVFIDSRSEVYGPELLAQFHEIKGNVESARRALASFDVDLVLVYQDPWPGAPRPQNAGVLGALESDPRWALLYVDDRGVLYARRDAGRALPPAFERLHPRQLRPGLPDNADPALEAEARRAVELAPEAAFPRFALGTALAAQGRFDEARRELELAYEASPRHPAAAQVLGEIALAGGDRDLAVRWFERALAASPHWKAPMRGLEAIRNGGTGGTPIPLGPRH